MRSNKQINKPNSPQKKPKNLYITTMVKQIKSLEILVSKTQIDTNSLTRRPGGSGGGDRGG